VAKAPAFVHVLPTSSSQVQHADQPHDLLPWGVPLDHSLPCGNSHLQWQQKQRLHVQPQQPQQTQMQQLQSSLAGLQNAQDGQKEEVSVPPPSSTGRLDRGCQERHGSSRPAAVSRSSRRSSEPLHCYITRSIKLCSCWQEVRRSVFRGSAALQWWPHAALTMVWYCWPLLLTFVAQWMVEQ
jgi:hypothetical protein